MKASLGIDCGSVSLNLALLTDGNTEPVSVYRRTRGRPLEALVPAVDELRDACEGDCDLESVLVTGSGRELLAEVLDVPAVNEISAHSAGIHWIDPRVRTIIEIGGQDSKFIKIAPPVAGDAPVVRVFRMNEICAAGTGAFIDEQAERLGIKVEDFGRIARQSNRPAPIAGRCAVFAKTDMIHQAQEGTPLPDILLGLAFALVRNYVATLIRGEELDPMVSLQGGVMSNEAVVHAFRELLPLPEDRIVIPRHHTVMGAIGCAVPAAGRSRMQGMTLGRIRETARKAIGTRLARSAFPPLNAALNRPVRTFAETADGAEPARPLVMGLDVGSVSVKGVIIDGTAGIMREDYRLSRSRTMEALEEVIESLCGGNVVPDAVAVTGSGRYLAGRLLDADLIVNEITAQAEAALSFEPDADTVVEIGGQDSKWIVLEEGGVRDFEMNRVCAAGTGSFLMAQAQRLDLPMGPGFSDAAFSAESPADLGNRCTVFMESDLIHHQNIGASSQDLAAGVCISIVHNYLERVANNKPLGKKVLFLGGVAATPAVAAAFEQRTGRRFKTPPFFRVSGALGAALKALEQYRNRSVIGEQRAPVSLRAEDIRREEFTCKGCVNHCRVSKYRASDRVVFNGGLCDKWEVDDRASLHPQGPDLFSRRMLLLEESAASSAKDGRERWGIARSPQFYEWFPFWKGYCEELGIDLQVAPRSDRRLFESGTRFLRAETCLPIKVMAGQIEALAASGIRTLFHPVILNNQPAAGDDRLVDYCPFIQASSQFFRGSFDLEWKEPVVSFQVDPDAFRREHLRFAGDHGHTRRRALAAMDHGLANLEQFEAKLYSLGEDFLNGLDYDEDALVVLGKPYHTADPFLNMNLGGLFRRIGVRAIPSDLLPPVRVPNRAAVSWRYQADIVGTAQELARHPNLFPVFVTFFGCGPDPFTLRHIKEALGEKPLLILEMDEHSSRAGMITRIEAYLDRIHRLHRSRSSAGVRQRETRMRWTAAESRPTDGGDAAQTEKAHFLSPVRALEDVRCLKERLSRSFNERRAPKVHKAQHLYIPYWSEHAYGFAAAARSVDVSATVLPPPDEESERLGRPHAVGGECHPYVLLLGDYLKLAGSRPGPAAERSFFYMFGPDACRIGQFPVYMNKVRQELGLSMRVIGGLDESLEAFGLSGSARQRILMRAWEGLNAFDLLLRLFLYIRPVARDRERVDQIYVEACQKLADAITEGHARHGVEDVLNDFSQVPLGDPEDRPMVAVTGDYYTRVVTFANNDVYREIEALGGTLWAPPTISDSMKMAALRDFAWSLMGSRSRAAVHHGLVYMMQAFCEFRIKGARGTREAVGARLVMPAREMWRTASRYAHTRLPAGITAPIATTLQYLDQGADGVLNLIALNCSYGTVVTAALARALKDRPGTPMLTLVYDGLKKTNEKTRLEAFMDQVRDRFHNRKRPARRGLGSRCSGGERRWGGLRS